MKYILRLFVLTGLLFSACSLCARYKPVDSLKAELKKAESDSIQAKLLTEIAWEYHGKDHAQAITYIKRALKIAKRSSIRKEAHVLIIYGLINFTAGESEIAIKQLLQALSIYEKINSQQGIATVYSNMGLIYNVQKNRLKALECYIKALKGFQKHNDMDGVSACYHNMAGVYQNTNRPELALEYFRKGLAVDVQLNEPARIAGSYHSLGEFYRTQYIFDSSLFYYNAALKIMEKSDLGFDIVRVYAGAANLHSELSNPDSAILYAQKAYKIVKPLGPVHDLETIYKVLAYSYTLKGNFKRASLYKDSLMTVKDSLYSSELSRQTEELLSKYESEKKDKAISRLKFQKDIARAESSQQKTWLVVAIVFFIALLFLILLYVLYRKSREEQKQTELEQKALRAQMNPHFIFNSLNSIQRMYVEGENDKANEYMGDFAELMRRILDNSNKNEISLKEELHSLKLYLELEKVRCQGMMNYEITVDEKIDQLQTKISPLVIQPFAENAIWHGILPKKQPGTLRITIFQPADDNSHMICTVEDDGVGMNNSVRRNHESKGISITEQRLGTRVKMEKLETGGTRVTLFIPHD